MSLTDPTAAELFTAVNAAILTLLANPAKSVSLNNRTYVYRDLEDLRNLRAELKTENASADPSRRIRLGDFE